MYCTSNNKKTEIYHLLQNDKGLKQILPYLVNWIQTEVVECAYCWSLGPDNHENKTKGDVILFELPNAHFLQPYSQSREQYCFICIRSFLRIIGSFIHSWESFDHSIIRLFLKILLENPSWKLLNVVLIIHSSTSSFLAFFRVVLANPCAITLTRITGSFVRCPPSWLLRSIDCLELNTQSFTSKL